MRSRHTAACPARKIGIDKLHHLIINQQPHSGGCTRVILNDPSLDRIKIFAVFRPANDAPDSATYAAGTALRSASLAALMRCHSSSVIAGRGSSRLA